MGVSKVCLQCDGFCQVFACILVLVNDDIVTGHNIPGEGGVRKCIDEAIPERKKFFKLFLLYAASNMEENGVAMVWILLQNFTGELVASIYIQMLEE